MRPIFMPTKIINSERTFKLWKYTVGHSQLLLRSTKSPQCPTRIDVFFKGVSAFHLPTSFTGLSIAEAPKADVQKLCTLPESFLFDGGAKVYKVEGTDFVGYVAALMVACHEDEGEYHAPSFFSK